MRIYEMNIPIGTCQHCFKNKCQFLHVERRFFGGWSILLLCEDCMKNYLKWRDK